MEAKLWFVVAGAVFILMGLSVTSVKRLPMTTAMLYVLVGIGIGPSGLALLEIDPLQSASLLEHVCEVAVIVSLFTAGLKLRVPLGDRRWRLPVLLATGSMVVSVGLVTAAGVFGLGLSLGAALLLGAVLAPTDPVLASDVQVEKPTDRDQLRFALTGEAALNDGTAFPFVMLGLGVLGLHEMGAWGWRWVVVDLLWSIFAGLAIGWLLGSGVGRLVLYLRRERQEAVGLDDFLALGLIALSYGVALLANAYGFLAVFAAGLALRSVEMEKTSERPVVAGDGAGGLPRAEVATHQRHAPAYMARAMLFFNEQLERIGEVAVVVLLGAILSRSFFDANAAWFVPLLLLVIRPVAVLCALAGTKLLSVRRGLISWFGIRGVGSIYYLMYAINHGIEPRVAEQLIGITLAVVTVSIVAHGISVTPLMQLYAAIAPGARRKKEPAP